jgi:CDP-2,3-bis-(O-geranylgeranyl)-sn-glycerol synthase
MVLLAVANGTPVIAAKILGNNSALPLDGNVILSDGKPLFGSSKTLRGVLLSILLTTACAPLIGLDWVVGSVVALAAMTGDLFSSFVKRRLGMSDSSQFTGLDQIPESLLPLLVCMFLLPLTLIDVAIATTIFFVGALVLSRILFKLNIRDRPY